jgi:iron complex outermembrane receptor protein
VRHAFAQDRTSQPLCGGPGGGPGGNPLADPAPGAPPCLDVRAPAYALVDLSAGVTLVRGALLHSLTLRADNLLGESYIDASSRIKTFARNPGRNLALVYRVRF